MAEKIISPGVFTQENDLSFVPQGISEIGGAIIGPAVKGPAGIPTVVDSYADYVSKFGNTFKSGSDYYQYLTSHTAEQYLKHSGTLTVVRIMGDGFAAATASITGSDNADGHADVTDLGSFVFKLHSLSDGFAGNAAGFPDSNGVLATGSADNLRYEITAANTASGTFSLGIRRGNDSTKRKVFLEQYNNLSLDPKQPNFISKVIGDMTMTVRDVGTTDPYLELSGSYENKSRYVRVELNANCLTPDFKDDGGTITNAQYTGSIPAVGTGSDYDGGGFGAGSNGNFIGDGSGEEASHFYDTINANNTQGFDASSTDNVNGGSQYLDAIRLLKNQDEYDINMLIAPGINQNQHSAVVSELVSMAEERGDCFAVVDPTPCFSTLGTAVDEAGDYDNSYAAMYWPWVQIPDNQLNKLVWVPPSVVLPGVIAFNDKVAAEWFAPAGLNRGGIDVAVRTERKLTHANRDDLYSDGINPIATFPGQGVCVWGQKTLQKKASALDRVNVRRLLINLKKFIASVSKYLVFENNTSATRNRFLGAVNPYMEGVQQRQGLFAFKVVMDETNNTPDVVDRNIMKGDIFIQPAKAAEFIVIDFNIMPTGATFED